MEIIRDINFLRQKSVDLTLEDLKKLKEERLVENMIIGMLENKGAGLSAVQVGKLYNLFVMKSKDGKVLKIVNPKILDMYENIAVNEGCLSFPGISKNTIRNNYCEAEWIDFETGEKEHNLLEGIEAVIFQHESDHLNGVLMLDRIRQPIVRKDRKIGRNELCPYCLEKGIKIKYKKCGEHFEG